MHTSGTEPCRTGGLRQSQCNFTGHACCPCLLDPTLSHPCSATTNLERMALWRPHTCATRCSLPSITWMRLGRRCGSHLSSSSAHTRRSEAGTTINSGHSSCTDAAGQGFCLLCQTGNNACASLACAGWNPVGRPFTTGRPPPGSSWPARWPAPSCRRPSHPAQQRTRPQRWGPTLANSCRQMQTVPSSAPPRRQLACSPR